MWVFFFFFASLLSIPSVTTQFNQALIPTDWKPQSQLIGIGYIFFKIKEHEEKKKEQTWKLKETDSNSNQSSVFNLIILF